MDNYGINTLPAPQHVDRGGQLLSLWHIILPAPQDVDRGGQLVQVGFFLLQFGTVVFQHRFHLRRVLAEERSGGAVILAPPQNIPQRTLDRT